MSAGATTRRCSWRRCCRCARRRRSWSPRAIFGPWAKVPRGGVCRGRDAEARGTRPLQQPDWRRGRGGLSGGGWEGRAAEAQSSTRGRSLDRHETQDWRRGRGGATNEAVGLARCAERRRGDAPEPQHKPDSRRGRWPSRRRWEGALPKLEDSSSTATRLATRARWPSRRRLGRARCRSSINSTSTATRLATRAQRPSRRRLGRARCRSSSNSTSKPTRLATRARSPAEAVGKGALPKLEQLYLHGNKLSQTAKDAWEAVKAKRSGLE